MFENTHRRHIPLCMSEIKEFQYLLILLGTALLIHWNGRRHRHINIYGKNATKIYHIYNLMDFCTFIYLLSEYYLWNRIKKKNP